MTDGEPTLYSLTRKYKIKSNRLQRLRLEVTISPKTRQVTITLKRHFLAKVNLSIHYYGRNDNFYANPQTDVAIG